MTAIEAYDLLSHARLVAQRLSTAAESVARQGELSKERAWLDDAQAVLAQALGDPREVIERALSHPELAVVRDDFARELQQQWVDALEKLHAGITFHASSRSPLLETLFAKTKQLSALRKLAPDAVEQFGADFEKRLGSGYAKRMLSQASFSFTGPVIEQVRAAFSRWRAARAGEGAHAEQAVERLMAAAARVAPALRQAQLLAEAALTPVPELFSELGLGAKPKRRTTKVSTSVEPMPEAAEQAPSPVAAVADPVAAEAAAAKPVRGKKAPRVEAR